MALKLGELLLQEKMVTPEQLENALKHQMIYGIKLGSSLIDMGYVEEGALTRLLSKKLGYPCASQKDLANIPQTVTHSFPKALAAKFKVMPLGLERNRLNLAMSDPTDFTAIEEIGFATGHVIQPYVAADVHISRALAKYYHISSPGMRYEAAASQFKKKVAEEQMPPATITLPTITETGELLNVSVPADFEGFACLLDDQQEDPYVFKEQAWEEKRKQSKEQAIDLAKEQVKEPELKQEKEQEERANKYSVDALSTDFASASNRDDVADVFITYLGQEFTSGALFIVRGGAVVGWRGVISGKKIAEFAGLSFSLAEPSVLRDVCETGHFVMGKLLDTQINRQLAAAIKADTETQFLVMPVIMMNKVVAEVLVSADMDSLGRRLAELQKLVRKASLAFEMLIIKNKILIT